MFTDCKLYSLAFWIGKNWRPGTRMVFIAVHIGAGYHSKEKRDKYLQICNKACEVAMKLLKNGASATAAVVEAIKSLEDDVMTNAGFGSNLNMAGKVECDASLMDGCDLMFGAVGALTAVKNPIKVAQRVLERQREPMPLGLIAPSLLVGEGANKFALANGCGEFNLISEKSRQVYDKYKRKLDEHTAENADSILKRGRFDTVGAIAVDAHDGVASGVSSGGLILKQEGRVGQASIIGAGCWAEAGVAISTSGIGEYITRTSLARECARELLLDGDCSLPVITKVFQERFFDSPLMQNIPREDHLAGILALIHDASNQSIELVWAHSTASMAIGYMSASSSSGMAFISEMPATSKPGSTVMAQSRAFKYKVEEKVAEQ